VAAHLRGMRAGVLPRPLSRCRGSATHSRSTLATPALAVARAGRRMWEASRPRRRAELGATARATYHELAGGLVLLESPNAPAGIGQSDRRHSKQAPRSARREARRHQLSSVGLSHALQPSGSSR
jgi:hypothetical protein